MLHDKNTLDKDKPGQQPEEGDSCHKHLEQERCLHSLADAVHVNVRDIAMDGKLLAGQGWLSTTATKPMRRPRRPQRRSSKETLPARSRSSVTESNLAHRRLRTHWLCISVPQRKSRPQTRSGGRVLQSRLLTDTGTLFASRVLGEQNEVPANRIRQVSPWHPTHGSAKNLRPTPGWRPVEVQTQTSQLGGIVDEAIVVDTQSKSKTFLQSMPTTSRLTSMKTPESTWEFSCVRASSLQLR